MNARVIIGFILMTSPIWGVFIALIITHGIRFALFIYSIVFAIVVIVLYGKHLIG